MPVRRAQDWADNRQSIKRLKGYRLFAPLSETTYFLFAFRNSASE